MDLLIRMFHIHPQKLNETVLYLFNHVQGQRASG